MERARGIDDEQLRWIFIELAANWNALAELAEKVAEALRLAAKLTTRPDASS
jgi:hypothetical protein